MAYPWTVYKTWTTGEILTAADLNSSFTQGISNSIPTSIDDYSANVATMRTTSDPYPSSAESLAATLAGELERLRYVINQLNGTAQWYVDPSSSIETIVNGTQTFAGAKTFTSELNSTVAVASAFRGNLTLYDSTAVAAGVGGQIVFGGKYTGSTYTDWSGIYGQKENATDGQFGGTLAFKTRQHGSGSMTTALSISSLGVLNAPLLSASQALVLDSSKNIGTSVTTVTELSYVSGVTSAIQTQFSGKVGTTGNETIGGNKTFSGTTTFSGSATFSSTVDAMTIGTGTVAGTAYRNLAINNGSGTPAFATQGGTTVSTATTILGTTVGSGGAYLVRGVRNSAGTLISFADWILLNQVSGSVPANQVTTIGSAVTNAPDTRTYTFSAGTLKLAMGANTYTVHVVGVEI